MLGLRINPITVTLAICFIFLCFRHQPVSAFNLDIKTPLTQRGNRGDMFGYSVAQHIDQGNSWMVVGAPRAQTGQPDIIRGGAVLRCKINPHNLTGASAQFCQIIPFDARGNEQRLSPGGNYQPSRTKTTNGSVQQSSAPERAAIFWPAHPDMCTCRPSSTRENLWAPVICPLGQHQV